VAAFGLDERTVRAWLHKAGAHAALLHDRQDGADVLGAQARLVGQEAAELLTMIGLVAADIGVAIVTASAQQFRLEGAVMRPLAGVEAAAEIALWFKSPELVSYSTADASWVG